MLTHNLGYPRIGSNRALKKANEQYWAGKSTAETLQATGKELRQTNWRIQQEAGIDLIPSNDFSYYDHVLDMSLMMGAIPSRYNDLLLKHGKTELDLYFAMARGYQQSDIDITAMEMTKWFDTNYHYIVPEFSKEQSFKLFSRKAIHEFYEAKQSGLITKPVLIGPITYLLLGKEKESGFHRIELLSKLLPVYLDLLHELKNLGAVNIQLDEPFLALDLTGQEKQAYQKAYKEIRKEFPSLNIIVTTYFDELKDNIELAVNLPINVLHIDLVRNPQQLDAVLGAAPVRLSISLGLVDGRNIWKNNFENSLALIEKAMEKKGADRLLIAPSCSLLHSPCDLDLETNEESLPPEIKNWMAFAKQKLYEISTLKQLASGNPSSPYLLALENNKKAIANRSTSTKIHKPEVQESIAAINPAYTKRFAPFAIRQQVQKDTLKLPLFPTTTIGSFPQTLTLRKWRDQFKKNEITAQAYNEYLKKETELAIRRQEEIGIDVLVHGEYERNDMVEYFGERLDGFAFTKNGWVQSYGSRCVKPPLIYGDVARPAPLTLEWTSYAQSLTDKYVKGMLTGPVTILQWSFVRDDQPRSITCFQLALAIRNEVTDLETAGIHIIQIDEPAIREGLPLRRANWDSYLDWAVKAFKIATSSVKNSTQIHTHMCYSEFNDIIKHIAAMDADVITIECSRSQMELLDAFADFNYPNEIGPGVYDIHSPRVPDQKEMVALLEKALKVIPVENLWINPDCGLKTRAWPETESALIEMVKATKALRQTYQLTLS